MTTKQMIEVMKAYDNGEQIECRDIDSNDDWDIIKNPIWNWSNCEYRVKPKQIEPAILNYYISPKKELLALVKDDFSPTMKTQKDLKIRYLLWYWEVKEDDNLWKMLIDSENNPLRTTWADLSDKDKYVLEAKPILSMGFRIPKDLTLYLKIRNEAYI